MKRIFILLLAALLLCGCAGGPAVPTQTSPTNPAETTLPPETTPPTVPQTTEPVSTPADAAARMATLREEDVYSFYDLYSDLDLTQLVAAMNAAAEHPTEREAPLMIFYSLDLYLNEALTTGQECFLLYAGLEENIVEVLYRNPNGDSERKYFESEELYWILRNQYRTGGKVDEDAYNQHREQLDAVAQAIVDETLGMNGEKVYTGFRVVDLQEVDRFENYTVYHWDVAFTTEDVHNVGWAGGMYLDASARVRAVIGETYFVVRGDGETRFLFWDLYDWGEFEEERVPNAHTRIQEAFAE